MLSGTGTRAKTGVSEALLAIYLYDFIQFNRIMTMDTPPYSDYVLLRIAN